MEQTEMMERYELAMERIRAIKEETSVSAPLSGRSRSWWRILEAANGRKPHFRSFPS